MVVNELGKTFLDISKILFLKKRKFAHISATVKDRVKQTIYLVITSIVDAHRKIKFVFFLLKIQKWLSSETIGGNALFLCTGTKTG